MGIPHMPRDLYVGVMVSQMLKEGHFDEGFQYFGCAYMQDDELKYLILTDEKAVYDAVERAVAQGTIATPVLNVLRRLKVSEAEREQSLLCLQEELKQKLMETFPPAYFSLLSTFTREPNHQTAYLLLEQYRQTVHENATPEKWQAFAGLVKMARVAKTLDMAGGEALLNGMENFTSPLSNDVLYHTISGFAYLNDDNQWRYYANGYRPKTVDKKIRLTEQRVLTTPIIEYSRQAKNSQAGQVRAIKSDFMSMMQDTFDKEYLTVLQQLYALPAAINKALFLKLQKSIEPELSLTAVNSLQGYGFLWHCFNN